MEMVPTVIRFPKDLMNEVDGVRWSIWKKTGRHPPRAMIIRKVLETVIRSGIDLTGCDTEQKLGRALSRRLAHGGLKKRRA